MRLVFRVVVKVIIRFLMWLLLRMEVVGLEKIPTESAAILAISHTNFLDPVLVFATCPRSVEALSKMENLRLFFFGPLIKMYGAIFVRRGEVDRKALAAAVDVLNQGNLLIVAPEGTRSGVGRLQKGRGGLAYIAARAGVVIIPVGIVGVEGFWKNLPGLRRTSVRMVFGQPFRFVAGGKELNRQVLTEMTTEAMYQLAAILPPARRGLYADLENATQNWLDFPDGVSNLERAEA